MELQGMKKFLQRYADLIESRKQNGDIAELEFQKIKSQALEDKKNFKTFEGARESNRKKNRYKDILPYDYTRVKLPEDKFIDGADYINANFIKDDSGEVCYIASQGPMPHTVVDFWRTVVEFKIKLIIMACKEVELGKARCQRYWPLSPEEPCQYDNVTITLISQVKLKKNMKLREMKVLTKNGEEYRVSQLHYMDWPDHGAPETSETILHLVQLAREKFPENKPPILVHCSAGCGRTGAIIAIDYARKLILKKAPDINVLKIVSHLRKQRPAMVQTKEQYEFIYEVIRELVTEELSKYDDDCNSTYVNIGYRPKASNPKHAEPYLQLNRSQSDSAFEHDDKDLPSSNSRKIVLPTESVVNTENFRRTRSMYGKNSPKMARGPPVPRKVSECGPPSAQYNQQRIIPTLPKKVSKEKPKLPAQLPNKARRPSDNYVNLKYEPSSPKTNEEYFPPAKPGNFTQYPMKSVTSSYLPTPQSTLLMQPDGKQNDQHSTTRTNNVRGVVQSQGAYENCGSGPKPLVEPSKPKTMNAGDGSSNLYSAVNRPNTSKTTQQQQAAIKPYYVADLGKNAAKSGQLKRVDLTKDSSGIKPYYVTDIGNNTTASSTTKTVPQKREEVTKKNSGGWTLTIQTSRDEDQPPALPERTPESFEVIRDEDLLHLDVSRHHVSRQRTNTAGNKASVGDNNIQSDSSLYSTIDEINHPPLQQKQSLSPKNSSVPLSPRNADQSSAIEKMKNWKNHFKKKSKPLIDENDVTREQDANKIMFGNTLYELKSLTYPNRITTKINGPPPPPAHWPKFPS